MKKKCGVLISKVRGWAASECNLLDGLGGCYLRRDGGEDRDVWRGIHADVLLCPLLSRQSVSRGEILRTICQSLWRIGSSLLPRHPVSPSRVSKSCLSPQRQLWCEREEPWSHQTRIRKGELAMVIVRGWWYLSHRHCGRHIWYPPPWILASLLSSGNFQGRYREDELGRCSRWWRVRG